MDKKRKCLCMVLRTPLRGYRMFGLMPITYNHPKEREFEGEFGQCEFKVSKCWFIYSILLMILYNSAFIYLFRARVNSIYDVLNFLNSTLYFGFSTLLGILGMYNTPTMVTALNGLASFQKMNLLCPISKEKLLKYSRIGLLLFIIQLLVLLCHDAYRGSQVDNVTEKTPYSNTSNNTVHNLPTMFQYMCCITCCVYWRLFKCYQCLMTTVLEKSTVYRINEHLDHSTSFTKDFCCSGSHGDVIKGKNLEEELDILRRLHEAIRVALMTANDAFNPQLTCFMIIDLGVLVMHLYSIILFFQLEEDDNESKAILFTDVFFVTAHTVGIIIMLKCAQQIKIMQSGPYQQLLKVSSRKLSPREFLQVRLFQIKLDATPAQFTSGRLSTIDISLLAPIAGSVVTYLMVALQIKMRKYSPTTSIPTSFLNITAEPE